MGGRGSSSGGMGGGGNASSTSTQGRLVQQSSDQWYGEWPVIHIAVKEQRRRGTNRYTFDKNSVTGTGLR